jgi:pyruvate/2-oxoglutarate dehydrogenase complex dihydrolipoamide acyltransferase (E2) component
MPDFKLPDLGEGVTEAEIDRWLVSEGDEIAEDAPLVEVITDKATAEIPSPYGGVVAKIHVAAGEVVPVGTPLVTVMNASDFAANGAPDASSGSPSGGPPPPPEAESTDATRSEDLVTPASVQVGDQAKVKATPPVRKLARSMGLELTQIKGTGPGGRITREDVEGASADSGVARRGKHSKPSTTPIPPGGRREPLRGVRRKIAERMEDAHRIVPPVTHVEECDVTELEATRKLANERDPDGPKLTFIPFIVKAVARVLQDYPALNASLDDDAGEVVFHDRYDIGVAVDTPQGLMVPVIREAHLKDLRAIAADVGRLAGAARDGKITAEDLRDGTFTVTSPGRFGGLMATPIIMHPQSGILGVHRAEDRPVVRDGQIVIRKMMNMSITFDHRILDGMAAAKFVWEVAQLLEHPAVLLLES